MEQNQFEMLEEVDKDLEVNIPEQPELKEYEKLLLEERNRKDFEKAKNLIKAGCFNQKAEKSLDFSKLEKLETKKQYKGLYDLYRNIETMQLMLVCPLVEDNKNDADENKNMKPYGYDVIYIEIMDNETYDMVMHAAKNNLTNAVTVLYRASFVCFFVLLAITLYLFIYNFIYYSQSGIQIAISSAFFYTADYLTGDAILLALLTLVSIRYRKYKNQ